MISVMFRLALTALFWLNLWVGLWLGLCLPAWAGELAHRVESFPNWSAKAPVPAVTNTEDLIYPDWFAGTWTMTSTLEEAIAPLAPELVTPGFADNQAFLHKPIDAVVRFVPARVTSGEFLARPLQVIKKIIGDRAFNGLSLARAYLGEGTVQSVKVDPKNPNRQIMALKESQALLSVVTGRGSETPSAQDFVSTELFQQIFQGWQQSIYLNEVENTTAYHYETRANQSETVPSITAQQITAIYLSPQDPNYFKAKGRPVALYKYHLAFVPLDE
jgi:hypothetical protein